MIKLKKWSWYAVISFSIVYLFVVTTLFALGERPAAYEIGLDSAFIFYLYIRRPMFKEVENEEEFPMQG